MYLNKKIIKILFLIIENIKKKYNKFFNIVLIYLIIELYYYIKYRIQLNYFNKIKPIHKKISINKIYWIFNQLSENNSKIIFLKNICNPISEKNKINSLIIDKYLKKNIFFSNNLNTEEINLANNFKKLFYEHTYSDNNEFVKSIEINEDRLECIYKPIPIYIFFKIIKSIYSYFLFIKGFKIENYKNIKFYYKMGNKNKTLLILHGLGIGIIQNNIFIDELFNDYNIIMPEIPNLVASNYLKDCLSLKKISEEIIYFLKKKNITNIILIGHSFGTIIINYLRNSQILSYDLKIDKIIYLEPVCFFNSSCNTYSIIYKENFKWDKNKSFRYNLNSLFIYYHISRDIYVQSLFKRYISPTETFEYELNMDKNTIIIVGGKDIFISPNNLKEYANKKWNVNFHFFENENHGFVLKLKNKTKIQNIIHQFLIK